MPTAPLLDLVDVSIRHDDAARPTPAGVTLSIAAGEVVLLLGPSGCGKSTLSLALDGLIPHAVPADLAGTVRIAGLDSREHSVGVLSEHVAMVFQDPDAQVVTGTLLDEVAFGPENQLVPADEVLARAERALKLVGLWERRADNPDRLSGGGRQRLAIACALAMASPVLVLDEPTANLDPAGIDEVYAVLRELASERDHAIVLVEHNLDAAVDVVDRVVVLDGSGRLVIDGPTRAVLRDRADELLALGVWLPVSTLAAMRLREAGIAIDPLPLTPSAAPPARFIILPMIQPFTPSNFLRSGRSGAFVSATRTSPLGSTCSQRGWSSPVAKGATESPSAPTGRAPSGQPRAFATLTTGTSELFGGGVARGLGRSRLTPAGHSNPSSRQPRVPRRPHQRGSQSARGGSPGTNQKAGLTSGQHATSSVRRGALRFYVAMSARTRPDRPRSRRRPTPHVFGAYSRSEATRAVAGGRWSGPVEHRFTARLYRSTNQVV